MKTWKGLWLMGVSAIHTLFAVVVFRAQLADILGRGVYDTVGEDPMAGAVAWFLLFGFVLAIAGLAIHHLERSGSPLPRSLGAAVLALAVLGIVLMPASGFWLALPAAFAMLAGRRREQPA